MKIASPIDITQLFNKGVDTSDDVLEGAVQLYYPNGDKVKVGDLPASPNAYLEIEKAAIAPDPVPEAGEIYFNSTDNKFYLSDGAAWIECLFVVTAVGA